MGNSSSTPVMQTFKASNLSVGTIIAVVVIMAILGVGTGYLFANKAPQSAKNIIPLVNNNSSVQKGKTYGSNDTKTFKDTTEGTLEEGGIEGEGQYHLVRPGGDSQNVYLTSSLVDLSLFKGRKIKVWGETQKAQKAGWLMDVGRVQVLN